MSKFLAFLGTLALRLTGLGAIPGVTSAVFGAVVTSIAALVLIPTGIAAAKWIAKPKPTETARIEGANTQALKDHADRLVNENAALKKAVAEKETRLQQQAAEVSAFQAAAETKERDNEQLRLRAPDPHAPVFGPDDPWLRRMR